MKRSAEAEEPPPGERIEELSATKLLLEAEGAGVGASCATGFAMMSISALPHEMLDSMHPIAHRVEPGLERGSS